MSRFTVCLGLLFFFPSPATHWSPFPTLHAWYWHKNKYISDTYTSELANQRICTRNYPCGQCPLRGLFIGDRTLLNWINLHCLVTVANNVCFHQWCLKDVNVLWQLTTTDLFRFYNHYRRAFYFLCISFHFWVYEPPLQIHHLPLAGL